MGAYCQGLLLFIEDVEDGVTGSVFDVVVDSQRDALDGVLKIWLRYCRIINIYCRATRSLFQRREVSHGS